MHFPATNHLWWLIKTSKCLLNKSIQPNARCSKAFAYQPAWPDLLIFGHLNNEKLPKSIKYLPMYVGSQFCRILNSNSRNGQKLFKTLPKWRNFAKSGHTAVPTYLDRSSQTSPTANRRSDDGQVKFVGKFVPLDPVLFSALRQWCLQSVWPDWVIYWTLAKINLPKSLTFLGNFCKCVKIIFGQLLQTFGDF